MLVCNVSQRPLGHIIAADLAEAASALDASTIGYVIFATIIDDPGSANDTLDAYSGEIMLEAASAADTVTTVNIYDTDVVAAITTTDAIDASVSPAVTTWNPADVTASILLSNGNLTADVSVAGNQSVRCTTGQSTGKFYFEIFCNHVRYNQGQSIGIATLTAPLSTFMQGSTPGSGTAAFCVLRSTGLNVYVNGFQQFAFASQPNNSDMVCVAVDMTNKRLWFRINNGNWNDNASYDPATNVGGQDISSVFSSGVSAYPYLYGNSTFGTGDMVMTANFGATAFSYTVPSGFTAGPH